MTPNQTKKMASDPGDAGWTTVVHKKSRKFAAAETAMEEAQKRVRENLAYLQKHEAYQTYRLKRDHIVQLLTTFGLPRSQWAQTIIIGAPKQCIGHLIYGMKCMECEEEMIPHCCCDHTLIESEFEPYFYLGIKAYVDDYLQAMGKTPSE